MKVIVAELSQESNSFVPKQTGLEDYRQYGILFGNDYREGLRGIDFESEGIFVALDEAGIDYFPAIRMRAQAGGIILPEVYEYFMDNVMKAIDENGPFDGAVISLHGATQSTESDDVCGDIVAGIRAKLGPKAVVAASFDLHGNITRKIFDNADFVCGYQTYPHVDFYGTGYRAGKLAAGRMLGKSRDYMSWVTVPMIEPASGYNTNSGACGKVFDKARAMVADGTLTDFSMFQMQPWLDVVEGGSAVVAVAKSRERARACAIELAEGIKAARHEMSPELYSAAEIVEVAEKNETGRPIVCVDFSDSANAGAAGDNSSVLAEMVGMGRDFPAAFIVVDTPAVEQAFKVGVGNEAVFSLGGTLDAKCSKPFSIKARVRSLHDGDFKLEGPSRGAYRHIGTCAVLGIGNIDVLVCRAMASTGDPQLYRHFGIEPSLYKLVMVKANTSFYAGYGEILSRAMFTDTRCAATADLAHLPFTHLGRTCFYPFSEIDSFDVAGNAHDKE